MRVSTWITWLWLFAGLGLIASELVHAGLIAAFLGVAALAVAGLRFAGLVDGIWVSFFLWSALSVGLTIPLRPLVRRYLPADRHYDPTDEDRAAFGQVVEVLERVGADDTKGRIRHQGTTWPATCLEGEIAAGQRARLLQRDKLAWIVEPVGELDAPRAVHQIGEGES